MGCCIGSLLCCFGTSACGLCCAACPSAKSSTTTRIAYVGILLLGVIFACIMTAPAVADWLVQISSLCNTIAGPVNTISGITGGGDKINCDTEAARSIIGYPAVYRVCLGLSLFFCGLALLMILVRSSKDPRSYIQNGFWFFKILIVIGIIIGCFFIKDPTFETAWMVIGAIGGFIFILIQLILIVDLAHGWSERMQRNHEEAQHVCWLVGLAFFTITFYIIFVAAVIVLYIFYASKASCGLNIFFVTFNTAMCIVLSIVSLIPKVQDVTPHSGLLQSSLISMYVMFLTWSAMTSNPTSDAACNPQRIHIYRTENGTSINCEGVSSTQCHVETFTYDVIIALIILLICMFYASFSGSRHTALSQVRGTPKEGEEGAAPEEQDDPKKLRVVDDEEDGVSYSYTFYHIMCMLCAMYVMMTLTHWYRPDSAVITVNASTAGMWVKISSSWICLLLYLWSLIAPLILKNRTFD